MRNGGIRPSGWRRRGAKKRGSAAVRALPRANADFAEAGKLGKARGPCMHARDNSEVVMMRVSWSLPTILCLMLGAPALAEDPVRINPTDPQPTCIM